MWSEVGEIMRVVFLEDVPGVADAATVKNVKNGYARNYLLPRKLAAPATPTELQALDRIEKAAQVKRNKLSADAQEVEASIGGASVNLELRAGPTGRLFGAVTSRMIASELSRSSVQTKGGSRNADTPINCSVVEVSLRYSMVFNFRSYYIIHIFHICVF